LRPKTSHQALTHGGSTKGHVHGSIDASPCHKLWNSPKFSMVIRQGCSPAIVSVMVVPAKHIAAH
jgi:hypothetical protein